LLFRRQTIAQSLTGIYMDDRGAAIATVEHNKGKKPALVQADWCEISAEDDVSRLLRGKVSSGRQPLNLVMADDSYQLLLIEAPRVEPSELRAAVRWKVKNLIDFHIDDAVIDVFEIPGQQERPQGQAMMYVIVARARDVRKHIDLIEQADLNLQVIDVNDMALRNLAAQLDEDVRGVAMLHMSADHGIVTLTRQSGLYLSRRLEVGTTLLAKDPESAAAQVTLEIQRSLDYYDSHFSQPPVVALRVLPGFSDQQVLIDALDGGLNLNVGLYDPAVALDCRIPLDDTTPTALLLAIGGALRREEISL